MVKSASRVKSAKPIAVEIPAEFLNDFVFLMENAAFPKAFPSEGKVAEAAQRAAKTDEVEMPCGSEIRLTPGEIILRMVKSASRVKSAKPVADEIPAEFLNDFVFLTENAAFPKAFPSEGKVAEAARRAAKTDEVEMPCGK